MYTRFTIKWLSRVRRGSWGDTRAFARAWSGPWRMPPPVRGGTSRRYDFRRWCHRVRWVVLGIRSRHLGDAFRKCAAPPRCWSIARSHIADATLHSRCAQNSWMASFDLRSPQPIMDGSLRSQSWMASSAATPSPPTRAHAPMYIAVQRRRTHACFLRPLPPNLTLSAQ